MVIPLDLVRAVREHRLVPFVGAGVSSGVKRGLFPTWGKLLEMMAAELEAQANHAEGQEVRRLMKAEDYLGAAERGLRHLKAYRFNRFLRGVFRKRRPADLDLSVVEALWSLRPPLVITTNYDDVLRWAGPADAEMLGNDQEDELALLPEASAEWPFVWHLHGTIQRLSTLILAGSDYKSLYGGDGERARRYEAALFQLNAQLANRPFLYVGFSLSDPYVLQQIADVLKISKGKGAPSFALMKKGQGDASALWFNYNIQLIEYEDHGPPLAAMLREISRLSFDAQATSASLVAEGTTKLARESAPFVPRPQLEAEITRALRGSRRLLLLAPRKGGARTLARTIAEKEFGERVTWLLPPNVPSCTEAEYFASLSGDPSVNGFLKLEQWLSERARALGGEHLVVVRHDGGPIEHLMTLGNALRRLVENPGRGVGAARFYVLVAGESACASLRLDTATLSLFSGAPSRHVPPLSVDEVRALLGQRGVDVGFAEGVHAATGGLPGLVQEALGGEGSLEREALTQRLARSPSVRGILRTRLAEDDRANRSPARHARTVLQNLLADKGARRLDDTDDDLKYPEVRLYYDGLVVSAEGSGETVFRCEAVRIAAERTFTLEQGAV
ncbi:SIR2 family protein [Polyangium sp. 15x6]|uniref:SIR2 family NAD-dependent protein deacylase n=1 Tax=Polyangium sp. 15x6 TaxID=3042687 RepID=UPI00249AFBCE|nr:SIR2 family protein [Polyangium sp. 15x6]MDI3282138.1 SIR2 family protein [Polyangium sp. 15x6]